MEFKKNIDSWYLKVNVCSTKNKEHAIGTFVEKYSSNESSIPSETLKGSYQRGQTKGVRHSVG